MPRSELESTLFTVVKILLFYGSAQDNETFYSQYCQECQPECAMLEMNGLWIRVSRSCVRLRVFYLWFKNICPHLVVSAGFRDDLSSAFMTALRNHVLVVVCLRREVFSLVITFRSFMYLIKSMAEATLYSIYCVPNL